MKNIYLLFAVLIFVGCKPEIKKQEAMVKTDEVLAPMSDEVLESAVIYEANIRQYSEEGTFSEFTKDIPQLRELGVKIIWLMPIYPISKTKSKGSLGSYYAISDYTGVNPEFGDLNDLKELIKVAHENEMYVVLDWVANHTGWDHSWINDHPEYYTKDETGAITHTPGTDWTDVADLNYENMEMRDEMKNAMKYWITEADIDGFRCDMAGMVPLDFWETTIPELRDLKPIFMLAEAWEPELLNNLFDAAYGWDTHHRMNDIAKGRASVEAWDKRMQQIDTLYEQNDILLNFVTNHDENSWQGTVRERMGDAAETMTVLSYMVPGMPLIYSGQEYDMNKRLLFFEKDTIIKTKGIMWPLLKSLAQLKREHRALDGGKDAASYHRIVTTNDEAILMFTRNKQGDAVTFLANMTDKEVTFTCEKEGVSKDFYSKGKIDFRKDLSIQLRPWEFRVLID